MTALLYYADPLLREFTTTIASIDPDRLVVTLAATAFYPEGGGQPADLGTVADTPVVDVQKSRNGAILHRLESPLPAAITPGDTVHGQVDWPHRHEYMQQHTGQHVLSGALMRAANAPTVSVHQARDPHPLDRRLGTLYRLAASPHRSNRSDSARRDRGF